MIDFCKIQVRTDKIDEAQDLLDWLSVHAASFDYEANYLGYAMNGKPAVIEHVFKAQFMHWRVLRDFVEYVEAEYDWKL